MQTLVDYNIVDTCTHLLVMVCLLHSIYVHYNYVHCLRWFEICFVASESIMCLENIG